MTPDNAWHYHSIIFGGSLLVSFVIVLVMDLVWAWKLLRGTLDLPAVMGVGDG